jgi:hypothetical protein
MDLMGTMSRRVFACLSVLAAAALAVAYPAAAAPYVDRTLGELPLEQRVRVREPRPVQLLYTFQTNGTPNGRVANHTRAWIVEAVGTSGLFDSISNEPVPGSAVLSITMNNRGDIGAAARRGFRAGLTFGLVGTMVTDHYEFTFEFIPGEGGTPLRSSVEHAIHSTIGRRSAPENGDRARNNNEALASVIRQSVAHGLNRLALNPAFPGAVPPGASEATAADPAAPVEAPIGPPPAPRPAVPVP